MDYFKKISVKAVPQTIIDSPIRIQEVAILQDSVDLNILGRVKFVNQSKSNVIAVFFDLDAKDISGETIPLENPVFIYQDMVVLPGELYGNEIAINLPDTVRIFNVHINKIVFEDGSVWKASDAKSCSPLPLEQMELPKENADRIKLELAEIIPNVEYINYYYQGNDTAWLCSCGRVNSTDEEICPFCDCVRSSQEQILAKDKFKSFCDSINDIVRKEQKKKQEEENRRKEEERRQQEKKEKREKAHKEEEHRKFKRQSTIIAVICVAVIAVALIIWAVYTFSKPQREYNHALSSLKKGKYQEAIEMFKELDGYSDSEDKINEAEYYIAVDLMQKGSYTDAISAFEEADGFEDSETKIKEANYNIAMEMIDSGEYDEAISLFEELDGFDDSENQIMEAQYQKAYDCFCTGDYSEAIELFKQLNDYKDSSEYISKAENEIKEANYNLAMEMMDDEEYDEAISLLEELYGFNDSEEQILEAQYRKAYGYFSKGEYSEAVELFEQLDDYKDSLEYVSKAEDNVIRGAHLSLEMPVDDAEKLLKGVVGESAVHETENGIRANVTSEQAAQLIGIRSIQDLSDIRGIEIFYNHYYFNTVNSFSLELRDNSEINADNIFEYVSDMAKTIILTDDDNVEYSFTMIGDSNIHYSAEFIFDGCKYLLNVHTDGEQSISITDPYKNDDSTEDDSSSNSLSKSYSYSSSSGTTHMGK